MVYFLVLLGAYLVGSFPTGVFISKRKYGLDVREVGSGNIGATNIKRIFGWYAGFLVFFIDFAKGAIPLALLNPVLSEKPWLLCGAGICLVLGHCYSLFLGFKGGKGVATSLGCIFVTVPGCAFLFGAVYLLFLKISKISAIGSLTGVLSCLLYLVFSWPGGPLGTMIMAFCSLIVLRHQENIRRLKETWASKSN